MSPLVGLVFALGLTLVALAPFMRAVLRFESRRVRFSFELGAQEQADIRLGAQVRAPGGAAIELGLHTAPAGSAIEATKAVPPALCAGHSLSRSDVCAPSIAR